MVLEKQKLEKGDKPKKSKGKGKAKLKIEGDSVSIFNYITQCEQFMYIKFLLQPYNQYSAFVDDFDDFGEYIQQDHTID